MVNVNKNIVPGKPAESSAKTEPKAPARRPRNQELNSSRTVSSLFRNLRNQRLNCSAGSFNAEFQPYYDTVTEEEYADKIGCDIETLRQIAAKIKEERGDEIVAYVVAKPEYQDAFLESGMDCGEVTSDGRILDCLDADEITSERIQDALDSMSKLDSSTDQSVNCEAKSAKVSGTVTIYNDFADLDNDTAERLLRSRIEKAVPSAKVDFEKVNDTDVKVKIDCPDADAEKARLAVESSDVTKSVDWESATEELDSASSKGSSETLNCSDLTEDDFDYDEDGSGISTKDYMGYTIYKSIPDETSGSSGYMVYDGDYPQSFDTLEECKEFIREVLNSSKKLNCSENDVVTITTESGNEVPLSEVKVIQNPSTNELMLYVPENDDDEIPDGFTVVYDVVQQGGETTPDPDGIDDGEDEAKLDSSRQNRAARRRARKLNSSKKKNRR